MLKLKLLGLLFLCAQTLWAQFYYPIQQDAVDFQKRKLFVQLLEEDDKILKALKSKYGRSIELEKRLEVYKLQIQKQNNLIKMAVSKHWKANKSIEFKSKDELADLLKDSKTLRQYAVLSIGWKTEYQFKKGSDNASPIEVYAMVAYVAEATDRKLVALKRSINQKTDYIFKVAFTSDNLEMSDYTLAVQQFNFHIHNAAFEGQVLERYRTLTYILPPNKAGYELIKKKTLLLPTNISTEDKTEELKLPYQYPYEIAEIKLFEEAIEQQFAKYVYTTLLWSDRQNNFSYFVINASEGIILAELGHRISDANDSKKIEETTKLETDPAEYYKNKTALSKENLAQLQQLLGPKN